MKKITRALAALGLVGLFGLQALHRHAGHDGGVYAPHVDCGLCAWAARPQAPAALTAAPAPATRFWSEAPRGTAAAPVHETQNFLPFGRAPPPSLPDSDRF